MAKRRGLFFDVHTYNGVWSKLQQDCPSDMGRCIDMFIRTRLGAEFFGRVCAVRSKLESATRVGETGVAVPQQTTFEREALAYWSHVADWSLGMEYRHWCTSQWRSCDDGQTQEWGYAVFSNVPNKTSEVFSSAIVSNLKSFSVRVKTLTYYNEKEFAGHSFIDQQLNSTAYFARPFDSLERGNNDNLTASCANTLRRSEPWLRSVMRKLELFKTD